MTGRRLSRAGGDGRRAPPVRLLHLGLGNFFRAHQAWYTEHAPDAPEWGHAAYTGRSSALADALGAQGGLYTLVVRGPEADRFELISSVTAAHPGSDHAGWLAAFASAKLAAVTITVTEAGYCGNARGGLDTSMPAVASDVARLRGDPSAPAITAPGRLVGGLAARRRAGGGPIALISCDNVAGNGALTQRVIGDMAALVDPGLAAWMAASTEVVTTVVDRITPRTGAADARSVQRATGRRDGAAVVTEPFSEWVLSGTFPAGRPRWEGAGALFTGDVTPYEHRKLWLLNGAHSLLAYAGALLGHETIAQAVADDVCRGWVEEWWAEASAHLDQPAPSVTSYQQALLRRFSNARLGDRLARIAEDGSQKLPVRVLPVLRAERAGGRVPVSATRILAAWICHLRGAGSPVRDVRGAEAVAAASGPLGNGVEAALAVLDPAIAGDGDVVTAVVAHCRQLAGMSRR